jgi:hypothetical protein
MAPAESSEDCTRSWLRYAAQVAVHAQFRQLSGLIGSTSLHR